MKNIFSIIVILASIGSFVFIVQPQYKSIQEMKKQSVEFKRVLGNARKLQEVRDELLEKRKSIKNSDVRRLEKLIPESADNVKLILHFEEFAEDHNLKIQAASTSQDGVLEEEEGQSQSFDVETNEYGVITLDFTIEGTYTNFISFLETIERNLRITDIRSLTITPDQEGDNYSYQISVDTYWLKDNI